MSGGWGLCTIKVSNIKMHACMLSCFSCVRLFAIPQTVACQLLCLWDSPGRNTGVGCHVLLQPLSVITCKFHFPSYQKLPEDRPTWPQLCISADPRLPFAAGITLKASKSTWVKANSVPTSAPCPGLLCDCASATKCIRAWESLPHCNNSLSYASERLTTSHL